MDVTNYSIIENDSMDMKPPIHITTTNTNERTYIELKAKVTIKRPANALPKFTARFQRQYEKIFNQMWTRQQALITTAMARSSLDTLSPANQLQTVLHDSIKAFTVNEFIPLYTETIGVAGKEQAKRIVNAVNKPMAFSFTTDRLSNIIKQKVLTKVAELTTQQIKSVRAVLDQGITQGWGSVKTARFMKGAVPLNEKYTKAYLNFYDRLGADPEISNTMLEFRTERYRKHLERVRREMIARTEIGRAYNEGNIEAVQQAIDGKIIKGAYKIWRTSNDSDVRDEHMLMEGQGSDGSIPIDGTFSNGSEYPDDVNERCTTEEVLIL